MPSRPVVVRRSITANYAIAICATVAATILVMAVVHAWFERRATLAQIRQVQSTEAAAVRDRLDAYFANLNRFITESARLPWEPGFLTRADQATDFRRLMKLFPEISTLTAMDSAGRELVFVDRHQPDRIGDGRVHESLGTCAAETRSMKLLLVQRAATNAPQAQFLACPAPPGGGTIQVRLNLEFVGDLVAASSLGDEGRAYVVDADRQLVAHPDVSLPRRQADFSSLPHLVGGTEHMGVAARAIDGRDVVVTVLPMANFGWRVVVEQPTAGVMKPMVDALMRASGVAAVMLLAGIVFSWLMTRYLVRPIVQMREGVDAFAAGNYAARVQGGDHEELQGLASAFNGMADQLQSYTTSLEQKVAEKTAQLERANRHKSEFLANMSHELRTPLNAVIGFSDALKAEYFGALNPKQQEYVQDIRESGQHLLALINDVLDLSKIEAGKMELNLGRFDLPTAIDNALTLLRERASRHQLTLKSDIGPGLGEVVADERKVKQVLINLLSNAVKFSHPGGWVLVVAERATNAVMITVRDNGVGIAREDQAAIFEEFHQLPTAGSAKQEGTGLGLTLTRRFVELHGGRLMVESEPGQGAAFSFTLPDRDDAPGPIH